MSHSNAALSTVERGGIVQRGTFAFKQLLDLELQSRMAKRTPVDAQREGNVKDE
jgi:hypothetical protein